MKKIFLFIPLLILLSPIEDIFAWDYISAMNYFSNNENGQKYSLAHLRVKELMDIAEIRHWTQLEKSEIEDWYDKAFTEAVQIEKEVRQMQQRTMLEVLTPIGCNNFDFEKLTNNIPSPFMGVNFFSVVDEISAHQYFSNTGARYLLKLPRVKELFEKDTNGKMNSEEKNEYIFLYNAIRNCEYLKGEK